VNTVDEIEMLVTKLIGPPIKESRDGLMLNQQSEQAMYNQIKQKNRK
jgi:hypothetical protein